MTASDLPVQAVSLAETFIRPFMKLAAVQPGERVLDLTCLGGEATVEAALRAGPTGEVLALDPRPEALDAAARRAVELGAPPPRTAVMDPAHLHEPSLYWDVALCHFGLPELRDPESTFKEATRVLRPVGRLAISNVGERDRCPLLTVFFDAVAQHLPAAAAEANRLFRYSGTGRLAQLLAEHGFEDAVPDRSTEWVPFRDVQHYWQWLIATSFGRIATQLSPDAVAQAQADIERRTRFYRRGGGLEIKMEAVILAAVK